MSNATIDTMPARGTDVPRGIGLTGRVAVSWAVAGGILLGGFMVALLTLTGRMNANGLLISSTLLFTLGGLAGFIHGGALGYLKDQGVDDEMAGKFVADLDAEGALLSVDLPSGDVTYADVKEVFHKYHGLNVYAQDARGVPTV